MTHTVDRDSLSARLRETYKPQSPFGLTPREQASIDGWNGAVASIERWVAALPSPEPSQPWLGPEYAAALAEHLGIALPSPKPSTEVERLREAMKRTAHLRDEPSYAEVVAAVYDRLGEEGTPERRTCRYGHPQPALGFCDQGHPLVALREEGTPE